MSQFADYPAPVFFFLFYSSRVEGVGAKTCSFCSLQKAVENVLWCTSVLWAFRWNRSLTVTCAESKGFLLLGVSHPAQTHLPPRGCYQSKATCEDSDSDGTLSVRVFLAVILCCLAVSSPDLARVFHPGRSRLSDGCLLSQRC